MTTNVPETNEVSTPRGGDQPPGPRDQRTWTRPVRFYHRHVGRAARRDRSALPTSGTTSSSSARRTRSRSSSTAHSPSEPFGKPAGIPDARRRSSIISRSIFPDQQALLDLRLRLKSAGCEVTDVVDHDFIQSIYFTTQWHRPRGVVLGARRDGPPGRLR